MTPEQLVERLKGAMPSGLRSVVLYGSAVAGDHVAGRSDYNVLVVADRLGVPELNRLAGPASDWAEAGNRAPLLFTSEELTRCADAFPIELLDMQQSRRILFGEDPLAGIRINPEHLRPQLERELKGKLLYLRERYLLTRGKPKLVAELLVRSLSTFLVLFRAVLRLCREEVPPRKLDALRALAGRVGFDPEVFFVIHELKEGRRKLREINADSLFAGYLSTIERVVDLLDRGVVS